MKQNNCQGCGCINEDQCICMKEELINIMKEQYKGKYITHHPAGVDITFNSWEEYNKYMVYENKIRKEYCDQAYETGIKDVVALKQKSGITNLLIYEAGVEDGIAKVKEKVSKGQDKSNKDKSQSKLELVEPAEIKVKVDNMQEFLDIWDVLYPKK
jgi:hypothetical protein